ncbi:MAG TPA: hypothetical protein VK753_09575 [Xanthomonadaceae bacterium]|jgi:hypothetical protein|nr:hypothetical protein [Xanthomonadaceae bacterium]
MKRAMLVLFALALCACASAQTSGAGASAAMQTSPATSAQTPIASTPAPPAFDPAHPDRSCKVDADCQVKDVGNCCGRYPECVNKDAPVDPKAIRAQCASEHRIGMCHVMAVGGCSCVRGQCSDINVAQMPQKP